MCVHVGVDSFAQMSFWVGGEPLFLTVGRGGLIVASPPPVLLLRCVAVCSPRSYVHYILWHWLVPSLPTCSSSRVGTRGVAGFDSRARVGQIALLLACSVFKINVSKEE